MTMSDPIKELPQEVQDRLDAYMERIKAIKWFQPTEVNKAKINKQVKFALDCFGVKASVEYRDLRTAEDWDAAWSASRSASWDAAWSASWDAAWSASRSASWDAAWSAAWDAAWSASWDAAWSASRDASRDASRSAAWSAARGAAEITASDLNGFTDNYPKGAFVNLIPLWEMGLYPVGVIGGKFVIYVPEVKDTNRQP